MDDRGIIGHGRAHVHDRRQQFIVHFYQVDGLFRDVGVVCRDCRQGVTVVENLVFRHAVLRHLAHVDHPGHALVDHFVYNRREIRAGHDRAYAGQSLCCAGVD